MADEFDDDEWPDRLFTHDRRCARTSLPECPACGHDPMHVDTRSADTLYLRCQQCGQKTTVAKGGPCMIP